MGVNKYNLIGTNLCRMTEYQVAFMTKHWSMVVGLFTTKHMDYNPPCSQHLQMTQRWTDLSPLPVYVLNRTHTWVSAVNFQEKGKWIQNAFNADRMHNFLQSPDPWDPESLLCTPYQRQISSWQWQYTNVNIQFLINAVAAW